MTLIGLFNMSIGRLINLIRWSGLEFSLSLLCHRIHFALKTRHFLLSHPVLLWFWRIAKSILFVLRLSNIRFLSLSIVVSYAWLATTQYWWMLQLFCFSWWLALLYCKSIWKTTIHEMAIWRVCTSTYMLVLKKGFFLLILSYVYCMVVFMLILHK